MDKRTIGGRYKIQGILAMYSNSRVANFKTLLNNMIFSIICFAALLFITFPFFLICDLISNDLGIFLAFITCSTSLLLLTCVLFSLFPILKSDNHSKYQDNAILISGLIALISFSNIENNVIVKIKDDLETNVFVSVSNIYNMLEINKEECLTKPRPKICDRYLEGRKIAIRQGSPGGDASHIDRQLTSDWSHLFQELEADFQIWDRKYTNGKNSFDEIIAANPNLSKNGKLFVRNVALLGGPLMDSWLPYKHTMDRIAWIKQTMDSDQAKIFGFMFFMTLFSLKFVKTSLKETAKSEKRERVFVALSGNKISSLRRMGDTSVIGYEHFKSE